MEIQINAAASTQITKAAFIVNIDFLRAPMVFAYIATHKKTVLKTKTRQSLSEDLNFNYFRSNGVME
jgi:hypothetical protein